MGAVPAAMPVTIPELAPTVPTAVLPLVQAPPPGISVSVVVAPTQMPRVPEIAPTALTVIVFVLMQLPRL
jgi:hypothetical protein